MAMIFAHTLASNDDYGGINVAWDAGFNSGWRAGARFMSRVTSRLRPEPTAPADKLNGQAPHTANGTGHSDSPMLPF